MTTIACDGVAMAGDGMISGGGMVYSRSCDKVARLSDGSLLGYSGCAYAFHAYVAYTEDAIIGQRCAPPPAATVDSVEMLILRPDGTCLCVNQHGNFYVTPVPAAAGSGALPAMAAMLAGADAAAAVAIAAKLDLRSGGDIRVLHIGGGAA